MRRPHETTQDHRHGYQEIGGGEAERQGNQGGRGTREPERCSRAGVWGVVNQPRCLSGYHQRWRVRSVCLRGLRGLHGYRLGRHGGPCVRRQGVTNRTHCRGTRTRIADDDGRD